MKTKLLLFFLVPVGLFAQTKTASPKISYTGTTAAITALSCTVGMLAFATDATAGQNIYECSATNVWTQQLNSGGGGSPAFSAITNGTNLGAAMLVGTGASLAPTGSGTITPSVGTGLVITANAAAVDTGYLNSNYVNSGTAAYSTLTDGATITWGISSALVANAKVTLGGNRTLNITSPLSGGSYTLEIIQDGTGSRTLTLGTGCTWKVSGGGSGAISLTTTAGAIDVLAFSYDGTNCLAAPAQKNFN